MKTEQIQSWIRLVTHKYLYILIVAAAGAVLLLWPKSDVSSGTAETAQTSQESPRADAAALESRIEQLLSKAAGVGQVQVLLTVKSTGRQQLASDDTRTENRQYGENGMAEDTEISESGKHLLLSDGSGGQSPYVVEETGPVYQGALVVCAGGDSPSVRLLVTEAVCRLTGLSSADVTVTKMQ